MRAGHDVSSIFCPDGQGSPNARSMDAVAVSGMNVKNGFALVRRPSSAVEKAAPGAKRILSGMIADTLVLANKTSLVRIVIADDEGWFLEMIEMSIRAKFKNVNLQMFQDGEKAWQELSQAGPNLLITDDIMAQNPELNGQNLVRRLVERKVAYPIIVVSGWPPTEKWVERYANQNPQIAFLRKPFTQEQLYAELSKHLGSQL